MPYQLEQGLSTHETPDHRGAKFHLLHNHRLAINSQSDLHSYHHSMTPRPASHRVFMLPCKDLELTA